MAASLPVITTRVGAIPEMIEDGVTGLLVAPGDSDGLRDALERLLQSPEQRVQMGNAARAVAERVDDAGRNAARVLDVLRSVSSRKSATMQGAAS
jgi:glycosyltransferase involved in cell wall biosynthesis